MMLATRFNMKTLSTHSWKNEVKTPCLGTLTLNDDATWWVGKTNTLLGPITWNIGGNEAPALSLLSEACQINNGIELYWKRIRDFLMQSKTDFPGYDNELNHLRIDTIILFWPERPREQMIFFHSPVQYRLWHCSMDNYVPYRLKFDLIS